jgi:hypothetical protein
VAEQDPPKDLVLGAIAELETAIDGVLPKAFPLEPGPVPWHLIATAFLARFADQLRAVAVLMERDLYSEAALVTREIYEYGVTFSWIAVDPASHVERWMENGDRSHLTTLHEAMEKFGVELPKDMDTSTAASLERTLPLQQMARAADDHWSERLPAFRPVTNDAAGLLTFSGMYTALYRILSRPAHGEVEGIDAVAMGLPKQVVVRRERPPHRRANSVSLCISIVGLVLVIYDSYFGGFDPDDLRALTHSLYPKDNAEDPPTDT